MTPYNASLLAGLFMAAYVPLTLVFDATMSRQRAVLFSMLLAVMFMPFVSIDLGGFVEFNRATALTIAVFFGVLLRDPERVFDFRPRWIDLPILIYCLVPIGTSVVNGLGLYDGLSGVLKQVLRFGGPYFIGRLFFTHAEHRRLLVRAVVFGALIYVPFCLWEIRMSPQLHKQVYGFYQHEFVQTIRGSSYRPMVFMQHGLMVAMWIAGGALFAAMMRVNRDPLRLFGFGWGTAAAGLAVVSVLMSSLGATLLLFPFVGTIWFVRAARVRWPLYLLLFLPLVWVAGRTTGYLDDQRLAEAVAQVHPDRARSFASRLYTEDVLVQNTWRSPLLGLGTWGDDRTIMVDGQEEYVVVDGLWILAFSRYGVIGLLAILSVYFFPAFRVLRRTRPQDWSTRPDHGVCAALALLLTMVAIDNLMNAMLNAVWLAIAGALANTDGDEPEEFELQGARGLDEQPVFPHVLGQPRAY